MDWDVFLGAMHALSKYQLPLWDAQIFAAAERHGASILLSEDFQHRKQIGTVLFLNPFAADFSMSEVLPT